MWNSGCRYSCACRHLVNERWLCKLHVREPLLGFAGPCRRRAVVEVQAWMWNFPETILVWSTRLSVAAPCSHFWSTVLQKLAGWLLVFAEGSACSLRCERPWAGARFDHPSWKREGLKILKRKVEGMNGEYRVFLCRARSVALNSEPFWVQLIVTLFRSPWFCCFKYMPPLKWKKIKYIYLCGAFCELVGHILNNPGNC